MLVCRIQWVLTRDAFFFFLIVRPPTGTTPLPPPAALPSGAAPHTLRNETQSLTRTISHFRLERQSANLPARLGNTKPRSYTRPGLVVNNG